MCLDLQSVLPIAIIHYKIQFLYTSLRPLFIFLIHSYLHDDIIKTHGLYGFYQDSLFFERKIGKNLFSNIS